MTVALIIPTYNAEQDIPELFAQILKQTLKPDHILVIDSASKDKTPELLSALPVLFHPIDKKEFDHGGTRKLAVDLIEADIYIFLTQDAIPASEHSFENLIKTFEFDPNIGCVYGRQLPKKNATPLSAHARLFNYPGTSQVRSMKDIGQYGIKTCFNSDSFAAYKKTALIDSGHFPDNIITGEDVVVAAKMLKKGYFIAYSSEATVYHSHNFNLMEEFRRYFSIGVFHRKEKWILNEFKSATDEGFRFVKSEVAYLIKEKKWYWIPRAFVSTLVKLLGYKLGFYERS